MPDPSDSESPDEHPGDLPRQLPRQMPRKLPLAGQTIVVTRAAEQAVSLCGRLEQLGAKALAHPVIRILPPENTADLDQTISRVDQFDWLVVVSTNSVRFLIDRFVAIHGTTEKLRGKKIAAIGQATSDQLERMGGLDVDLIPTESNSQSLGAALRAIAVGQKLLIARADRRTSGLTDILSEAGIEFEEVISYRSSDVETADPEVAKRMAEGTIGWVTITSGAIARSAARVFGENLQKTKLVSISPGTSAVLRELGFEPDAEAVTYDMDGIVDAIEKYVWREI